jgi:hypothetical protein
VLEAANFRINRESFRPGRPHSVSPVATALNTAVGTGSAGPGNHDTNSPWLIGIGSVTLRIRGCVVWDSSKAVTMASTAVDSAQRLCTGGGRSRSFSRVPGRKTRFATSCRLVGS